MKGLTKLLMRYIFASEAIFFVLVFPIILFGIMGEAFIFGIDAPAGVDPENFRNDTAATFIAGISVTTLISSGLFLIPITIVDFKNSVLMKRIGATNIRPWQFLVIVLCLFVVESSFSFFYTRLVATIIFGPREAIHWNVAFPSSLGVGFLWTLLTMSVAIAIGLVIASFTKTVRQTSTVGNIIYFPVSVLSGGLIPVNVVYNSAFLKSLNWINPFRYSLDPYFNSQGSFGKVYDMTTTTHILFPIISVAIILFCFFIVSKKLKWTN